MQNAWLTARLDGVDPAAPILLVTHRYHLSRAAMSFRWAGFDDITATDVPIIAGVITTQDFDLVRPVLDAAPTSFDTTVTTGKDGSGPGREYRTLLRFDTGALPAGATVTPSTTRGSMSSWWT